MKMKMTQHNGTMVLTVSGARQQLIITEEDGCFVIEMVNTAPTLEPVHVQAPATPSAPVHTSTPAPVQEEITVIPAVEEDTTPQGNSLFEKLVALRKSLATIEKIPPYLIFHDKTLHEMADKMPTIIQDMANISGVGQAKLEKYGPVFLEAINGVAANV